MADRQAAAIYTLQRAQRADRTGLPARAAETQLPTEPVREPELPQLLGPGIRRIENVDFDAGFERLRS